MLGIQTFEAHAGRELQTGGGNSAHRGGGAGLRDLWHLKDDQTSKGQSGYGLWRKP